MRQAEKRTGWIWAALLAGLWAAGCDSLEIDGAERLDKLYTGDGDFEAVEMEPDWEEEIEFEEIGQTACTWPNDGLWVARLADVGTLDTGFGKWPIHLYNYFIVKPNEEATRLELTFCWQRADVFDLKGRPNNIGKTDLSDKTARAIGKTPIIWNLTPEGELETRRFFWLWGLRDLPNPYTTPVPEELESPYIYDVDEDGFIGFTYFVYNPEGYRYMVRREIVELKEGEEITEDQNWVTFEVDFQIDQVALKATNNLLMTVVPIAQNPAVKTYFQFRCVREMEPIDGDWEEESDAESDDDEVSAAKLVKADEPAEYDCNRLRREHQVFFQTIEPYIEEKD